MNRFFSEQAKIIGSDRDALDNPRTGQITETAPQPLRDGAEKYIGNGRI
jgi:hypothetical protein